MRVVLVGTAYPMRGGIAHYIALLYQKMTDRGHRVHVLSFKRQYPSLFFPGKTQQDLGKELIHLESHPLLDSINPLTWIRAAFWLRRVRPDVLIFKYWMPFFAPCYASVAFLARTFLKARVLYICDNIVPHEKKVGDRLFTRLGLAQVDGFIVQSGAVRKDLLRFKPGANYREVPHPVYEIFPPSISRKDARKALNIRDERVLLYFGYIRAYKGLRYLIEAMPRILERFSVKLLVCGEFYEGHKETFDLIDRLDVADSVVVFDGFIPNEEVHRFFCASDLVVLPYVSATQSGIVQIAYHYDRPVVATRVGGLLEVIIDGKTGYLVEPRDSDTLAAAVVRFFQDGGKTDFEKNIAEEKKKYSWDRMVDAIEELAGLGQESDVEGE